MQTLLSPLPDSAVLTRAPVASAEVLASAHGALLAGWEHITAEVPMQESHRIAMVSVDGSGTLLTVNDHVTTHGTEQVRAGPVMVPAATIESVGGRVERDGTIRGTRWSSRVVDDPDATPEEPSMESTPSALSESDVAGLRALAAELLKRGAAVARAAR